MPMPTSRQTNHFTIMSETTNGIALWNDALSVALKVPGVKVERISFLRTELKKYCTPAQIQQAIDGTTAGVVPVEVLDSIAKACIRNNAVFTTTASFVAGLPGGFAMLGTVPADMAQYLAVSIRLAQQLAYIYGWPELTDDDGKFDQESYASLTIFMGAMMGVAAANELLNTLAIQIGKEMIKRISKAAITKGTIYPAIKKVAGALGAKMTTKSFAQIVGKSIPILGGGISAIITAVVFVPSAKKLQRSLRQARHKFEKNTDNLNG